MAEGRAEAARVADRRVRAFVAACAKIEIVRQAAAPISAYHPVPAFRFCRFGANIGTPFWLEGAPIRGKLMGPGWGILAVSCSGLAQLRLAVGPPDGATIW